ncbi:glycosyltransferase family 22 protein [Sistotremastrum suecicum HHB10207 ss-3]|uniref:Mannosyltransferase n=1 Tax=Sistotremastrum suecicum HHB10207 ss-3 TaxID=1314776 RepID=A0A165ZL24_9AGAM|nr:glycosyltransferase family 22 protein [Sistotremastrum suecicum HHB10207 ss-3]
MRLVLIFALRISIAVLTRTFFQPDEFFQCLEPAHRLAFGYGHLTWEWLSAKPIRTIAYPAPWALLYKSLQWARLDETSALIIIPKIFAGFLAAFTDIAIYEIACRQLGKKYGNVALFLSLSSFFHSLALTRSLATSMETILTTVALSFWPFSDVPFTSLVKRRVGIALSIAAFSCILRPTSAIIWSFLFIDLFIFRKAGSWLIASAIPIGCVALAIGSGFDRFGFSSQYSPSILNFLGINSSSVASFYGRMPWHYYLVQALPILCNTALPFALHGAISALRGNNMAMKRMAMLVIWTTFIYSLIGHKEWRFLHPILPLLHILGAKALVDASQNLPNNWIHPSLPIRRGHAIFLLSTIPLSIYVILFHGRAQIEVMEHIRGIPSSELRSVGFLMPCHSTPWQSHLHRPELDLGSLWALGCEPPLPPISDFKWYQDQTDVFFESPIDYLITRFPRNVNASFPPSLRPSSLPGKPLRNADWSHEWPSHLVFFGALLDNPGVRDLFIRLGYRGVWSSTAWWEEDLRRRKGVRVWQYTPSLEWTRDRSGDN